MSSSHESFPSSADLSSAEESPATSPQLTQTTSKANTNADNNTNTDSNVQTSPKGIMTAKLHPRHHFRKKSNSISNGVLQHARSINKKVSFSKFAHTNSSQVFTSSASSSGASSRNSSDLEDDDDDDEDTHNPANITNSSHPNPSANPGPHPAHFLMSVTPSPNTISPSVSNSSLTPVTSSSNFKKNYALRKLAFFISLRWRENGSFQILGLSTSRKQRFVQCQLTRVQQTSVNRHAYRFQYGVARNT